MRQFFKSLILFIVPLILFFSFNFIINIFFIKNEKIKAKKCSILIIGDSHFQRGINPSQFNNAENMAQLGEPYIISYWKLKKLLPHFKPDTVILGFAPHNISTLNDTKFSDPKWSSEMFQRSLLIGKLKDTEGMVVDKVGLAKVVMVELFLIPRKKHIHYIGKFAGTAQKKKMNPKDAASRHFYNKNEILKSSETSIAFLEKMVTLLKSRNITPILVCTPVHSSYLQLIPPSFRQTFTDQKEKFKQSGIKVLDYSELTLPDSLFMDADHLNMEGSRRFTQQLITDIHN